ncbi:2-amino-4-hydroxy-6-hydroxymethyldihydropteridine diphosphokinase [Thorsellia anophelis]|uniref:2-amino-4-hydroxy-6-hydroxymethyldihydropteridine pyrophosphokinase n=1 Tax=Thorsellia anophelis DSM 18579 TaxID=1123402 RepID=A0A1H9Y4N6_9GAMM|nr:2-amino-4-hydroxy-6-hydroxymethyldihydropteridine diphosphokinase [Thorsellia anophelis]SES63665.1 2-amino-4-hydroxy-6-hydroxymethyldihydropteridinediphosphokinase [Thorsellia anophelis DSM 18579]
MNEHNTITANNPYHTVYLALGSNLGDPYANVNFAIEQIKKLPNSKWMCVSSFYRTKPLGGLSQDDYLNAVACIETQLSPIELLDKTQSIELKAGRIRTQERFASRTLDIDILLFGNEIVENDRLTIPHYGLKSREFMLYPLFEIAPDLILPEGEFLSALISKTDKNEMQPW